jgi:hypothetical protein
MGQYKPEPKEKTTEPSVELKLKRGGHAKHHAEGGSEHKAEMHEMHKIEKELKHHEGMKAGKAHHGLKHGGKVHHKKDGGLMGSVPTVGREGKPHGMAKATTGGVEGPGYKHGGKIHHKADGGVIKGVRGSEPKPTKVVIDRMVQNKAKGGSIAPFENSPHEAKQAKGFNTKTGDLEGPGYKRGGKVLHKKDGGSITKYEADMTGFTSHKGGKKTGEIKEAPAGYKHGGKVHHKAEGGHMDHHKHAGKHHDDHGHKHMHAAGHHESHGHIHHKMHEHKGGVAKKAHGGSARSAKTCNY